MRASCLVTRWANSCTSTRSAATSCVLELVLRVPRDSFFSLPSRYVCHGTAGVCGSAADASSMIEQRRCQDAAALASCCSYSCLMSALVGIFTISLVPSVPRRVRPCASCAGRRFRCVSRGYPCPQSLLGQARMWCETCAFISRQQGIAAPFMINGLANRTGSLLSVQLIRCSGGKTQARLQTVILQGVATSR